MKENNRKKIIDLLQKNVISPLQISETFDISRQMSQRYLKKLLEENIIEKIGTAPRVFYKIKSVDGKKFPTILAKEFVDILDNNFYRITPGGKELIGKEGFISWCNEKNFDIQKKAQEFFDIVKKYQKLRKSGLLDATSKLKKDLH